MLEKLAYLTLMDRSPPNTEFLYFTPIIQLHTESFLVTFSWKYFRDLCPLDPPQIVLEWNSILFQMKLGRVNIVERGNLKGHVDPHLRVHLNIWAILKSNIKARIML